MRAVIIDDESDARKSIRFYLETYLDQVEILGEADGVQSGITLIEQTKPSIVFLDIAMKDGSGFDLLNGLSDRKFQLVFVTGYDEYALKAFKYSAIDYLLKPIDIDDFNVLKRKILVQFDKEDLQRRIDLMETQLKSGNYQKIAIRDKDGTKYIEIKNILSMKSAGNYTVIMLLDSTQVVASKLLKEFEGLLDATMFFRVHRSYIVNVQYISQINSNDNTVVLQNGIDIPISRRRKKELKELLKI